MVRGLRYRLSHTKVVKMNKRRVVVTGLGVMSPVGLDLTENRRNIFAGVSGISRISSFDPEGFSCQVAGEMPDFDVENYMSAKQARKMDRFMQLGFITSLAALKAMPKKAGSPSSVI